MDSEGARAATCGLASSERVSASAMPREAVTASRQEKAPGQLVTSLTERAPGSASPASVRAACSDSRCARSTKRSTTFCSGVVRASRSSL